MINKDIDFDFGSTIDRTIPNGTKLHSLGMDYIFKDGYWLNESPVLDIADIECIENNNE